MMSLLPRADRSASFSCPCHASVAALFSPLPFVLALLLLLPLPTNNTGNYSIYIVCVYYTNKRPPGHTAHLSTYVLH